MEFLLDSRNLLIPNLRRPLTDLWRDINPSIDLNTFFLVRHRVVGTNLLNLPATLFRGLGRGHPGELISGCPDRGSSAARARRARGPVVIGCRREEAGLSFREISEIEVRTRRSNGPDGWMGRSEGRPAGQGDCDTSAGNIK